MAGARLRIIQYRRAMYVIFPHFYERLSHKAKEIIDIDSSPLSYPNPDLRNGALACRVSADLCPWVLSELARWYHRHQQRGNYRKARLWLYQISRSSTRS